MDERELIGSESTCHHCGLVVKEEEVFCTNCGGLLHGMIPCGRHADEEADGVCVICSMRCCSECGGWMGSFFLCNVHKRYEVREGKVGVFRSAQHARVERAAASLKEAGLHPDIQRDQEGGRTSSGEITETDQRRVVIPIREVLKAEKILRGVEMLQ